MILTSIIIITKNQKHLLQKTLPILLKQNLQEKYEIIVVDSGSTDGALDYIKSLPVQLIKIHPKKFNYAKAFNTGAKKSKGEYLVRLSGDAIPLTKNWLEELIKPFDNPRVGATYGKYVISNKPGSEYPFYWPAKRFPSRLTIYSYKIKFYTGIEFLYSIWNPTT